MSRTGTITRRAAFTGALAVGGGLAFGTWRLLSPDANPVLESLEAGQASFNPWVLVDTQGVTLITPHADTGQGATSLQALLIAEEMDLEPGGFETTPGFPARAYRNRALSHEAVPFMSTDQRFVARATRAAAGGVMKLLALQITGGSTTVPDSFDKLRRAGAVARETLKGAAAARTGIPVAELTTQAGAVQLPDGTRIPYPELAAEAVEIRPVEDVTLRPASEWKRIGTPQERLDMRAKSTGGMQYGIDLWQSDMLFASVRANPRRGGVLKSFDATDALNMPGVRHVLALPDAVAVVADNTWTAFQALEAIRYDWGPAPFASEQETHWQRLSDAFADAPEKVWRDDGDVSQITGPWREYRAPYVAHQPLEPLNATIRVEATRAEIHACHQIPGLARDRVAEITGLPAESVMFHNLPAGGSFGHRLEFDTIDFAAEIGRQLPDETIKITLSREEDFARDIPRQIAMCRARGATAGGRVTSLHLRIAAPSVTRSQSGRAAFEAPGPDMQTVAGAWNMPFAIPDLRVSGWSVSGLAPVSSWRSVGASTAGFFAECALDELMVEAGADPMLERLRLVSDPVARAVLEAVADISDWGRAPGSGEGRGVALVMSFGVPVAQVIDVTATDAGIRLDHVFVVVDAGSVLDPVNFGNQIEGGVLWGLGHAINSEITYAGGMAQQSNYHDAPGLRLWQTPQITLKALQDAPRIRGIGEPPVPPAAPALANAIFAATGQRLREMPFERHISFV